MTDRRATRALSEAEAVAALERLYAEADAALASMGSPCQACGACCRFADYDHVPMCTNLEAACLLARHGRPPAAMSPEGCGFQRAGRCTARAGRPLTCRTFLCTERAGQAVQRRYGVYERIHRQIKTLCVLWPNGYRYGPLWQMI